MADAAPPTATQAADMLDRFIEPMKALVAFHEHLKAHGGLEGVANEAQGRAQAAQRDAEAAHAALMDARAGHEAAKASADEHVANAAQQAQDKLDAAAARHDEIIAQATASAAKIIDEANGQAAALKAGNTEASRRLTVTQTALTKATNDLAAVQSQMDALKAKFA
jgi:hypothetical protein